MGMFIQIAAQRIERYLALFERFFLGPQMLSKRGKCKIVIAKEHAHQSALLLNIMEKQSLMGKDKVITISPIGLEWFSPKIEELEQINLSVAYLEVVEPLVTSLSRTYDLDTIIIVFANLAMVPSVRESRQNVYSANDDQLYKIAYGRVIKFLRDHTKESPAYLVITEYGQLIGPKKSAQIKRFFGTQ